MDILQQVQEIIAEKLGYGIEEVTADADISDDLGADSLDKVELVMEFEKHFSISIPDHLADEITRTPGHVARYLADLIH